MQLSGYSDRCYWSSFNSRVDLAIRTLHLEREMCHEWGVLKLKTMGESPNGSFRYKSTLFQRVEIQKSYGKCCLLMWGGISGEGLSVNILSQWSFFVQQSVKPGGTLFPLYRYRLTCWALTSFIALKEIFIVFLSNSKLNVWCITFNVVEVDSKFAFVITLINSASSNCLFDISNLIEHFTIWLSLFPPLNMCISLTFCNHL